MDILGRHRIAFNNIGVQLFADLEKDLEPSLKKGVEEKAALENVINGQKKLLKEQELILGMHERTKAEQAEKIAEQKQEISQLKYELAKAVLENENFEEVLAPEIKSDRGRRRTVLGTPPRKSLQDKENIFPFSPVFNYLAPTPQKLPTLEREISPPQKSPTKSTTPPLSLLINRGMQTEGLDQNNEAVQTDLIPAPKDLAEAYYELTTRYDALRNDINKYKGAHQELQGKYLKNKKVWEAWIKIDKERLEQAKRRKRDGSVILEGGERQVTHGYTTPATSIAGRTPYTRPPTLSPNKPIFTPEVSHTISKKAGLFAEFKLSTEKTRISDDLGVDIGAPKVTRDTEAEPAAAFTGKSRLELKDNDGSSLPSVPEPKAISGARKNPKSTPTPDLQDHIDSNTDSESNESRDTDDTPTQRLYDRPPAAPPRPDPVFKVPATKPEKLNKKRTREGDSMVSPVVIKSEPSAASSEGFGYHLYEQESLDLDDIGYKPDTPRKRQRVSSSPVEGPTSSASSSSRPGWSNGGFTIKRAPGVAETQDLMAIEDTQDEDEGIMWDNEETSVPALPSLVVDSEEREGTRVNSQLGRPQTLPGAANGIPIIMPTYMMDADTVVGDKGHLKNDNEMRSSPPLMESRLASRLNQPLASTPIRRAPTTAEELVKNKATPEKSRMKRRVASRTSIEQITEDGTDGTEDVDADDWVTLSGKQKKKLEGIPKLSDMLNSPAPKTPSLVHLKKKVEMSKSVPSKKTLGNEARGSGSISEPPKRNCWVDSARHTKGRQKGSRQSKLDISHFRVNPKFNDGRDYAFAETVRNREARKCLPSCAKSCCKELTGFVEAAGLPSPAPRGPRWRSSSPPASIDAARSQEVPLEKKFTTKFGKHRDAFARHKSPPGFWDAGFPDTQDLERQHEAAEEMRLQKVEEMRREAEKGGKGRYVYKD